MSYFKHASAVIDEGAVIGNESKIWHFTHVMGMAKIGAKCILGQNVFIGNNVVLGDNCKVQNNVSLYDGVECDDDVFLGPSAVFTNVINPRSNVSRKDEFKQTKIHKGASVGANATIVCGVEIGEYAFIGAGAVIVKNVPSYASVVGNPSRQIGWMSRNGQKLEFENGKARCQTSGESYILENGHVRLAE